jgi:hypothetical protein
MSILRRRFVRCGGCGLRWIPERAPKACPACGSKALGRGLEPFHLGALFLAASLALGAVELVRAATPGATPDARSRPPTARIESKKLVVEVEAGPLRGRRITLRRGDVVEVKDQDGSTLLVEDARGNQVHVALKQVKLQ